MAKKKLECDTCGKKVTKLYENPEDPHLAEVPCVCFDCYEYHAELMIETHEHDIKSLRKKIKTYAKENQ